MQKMNISAKGALTGFFTLVFLVFMSHGWYEPKEAKAATITSTATGGAWATTTTWVSGVVPATGDTVIIATTGAGAVDIGANLTQTAAGSVTVNSGATLTTSGGTITFGALTISSGGTATLYRATTVLGATSITGTINFGSTTTTSRLMTFTGNVTLNNGAVWNETATGNVASFSFGGNLTNNATTFTAQNSVTAVHTFTGAARTISGATATAIPYMTISGTPTNNGTLSVASTLAGAGTLTNGATGILNIGAATVTPTLMATAAGNMVNYNGAGAQTVKATTYSNLILSGGGVKSIATGTAVNGNLSIQPSGSATASVGTGLNLSISSLTLGGLGRISGTWGGAASGATNINTTFFAATTGTLNVATDTRASSSVTTVPVATAITFGQTLASSALSGGSGNPSGGTFTWTNSSIVPVVGTSSQNVTYTPVDLTSYTTSTGTTNVMATSSNVTLTITTAGAGSGTVYSSPGTIACASGNGTNCSDSFSNPTDVTLTAAPDWKSETTWTGGCIGTGNTCGPFILNGNTSVTATFDYKQLVMMPGPTYYATIQDAYNACVEGTVLKGRDQTFTEDLVFDKTANVTFEGGNNVSWAVVGDTTINGTVTMGGASGGSVTISNMIIL